MNAGEGAAAEFGTAEHEQVLVTGFPAFVARRVVAKILASDEYARVHLLSDEDSSEAADAFVAGLPPGHGARVRVFIGAVERMDLGLSGDEYRLLVHDLSTIHHLAGIANATVDEETAHAINVAGTKHVIELATDVRDLRRLCHYSTTCVSGKRRGVILEDELECGQSFHNQYERTRFEAEKVAKAAQRRLPLSIFRLGVVVGDSRTGEIDRFAGPYLLMVALAGNHTQVGLPAPRLGDAPLNLVPIDFVDSAAYALSVDKRAAGKTFHLTDPGPLSARRVYQLVAECCGTKPPRPVIPNRLARLLLRVPGVERVTRGQRAFLDELDHHVVYSCRNTLELLADTGIRCPPFESYVGTLMRYVMEHAGESDEPGAPDALDELDD
jgi:thioester reductase-like protein